MGMQAGSGVTRFVAAVAVAGGLSVTGAGAGVALAEELPPGGGPVIVAPEFERHSDRDGMSDEYEAGIGTDPTREDSDGDGLWDNVEHFVHKSDPNAVHSDLDGLTDDQEVLKYGTNPNLEDSDEGGVWDNVELHRGTDPKNGQDDSRALVPLRRR